MVFHTLYVVLRHMMKSSASKPLINGVYAASLTPMHPDLSIDEAAFADHCKDLMHHGCNGVALFGTTGEGVSFSVAERKKAIESLIARGVDPQRLMVGIICCPISDVVEMAIASLHHGCIGLLIAPPFYYKGVEDDGVIAFYREIIQRVGNPGLKIILYHIPQFTGVPITVNVIRKLYDEYPHQVIGMKESEGNFAFTKEVLKKFPGFKVFLGGQELQLSEAVELGAAGTISGSANVIPELLSALYENGKNYEKADVSGKIRAILEVLKPYPFLPAFKSIVEKRKGAQWHTLRPPLLPLKEGERRTLNEALDKIIQD